MKNAELEIAENIFREKFGVSNDVIFKIHIEENEKSLYEKRLQLTNCAVAKRSLIENKERYLSVAGTWIYPPLNDKCFDVLLLKKDIFEMIYNYLHELIHIKVYLNRDISLNYLLCLADNNYCNSDEFLARYYSTTLFFCCYLNPKDYQVDYSKLCSLSETLFEEIDDKELVDDNNVLRYSMMQYLGFVYAIEVMFKMQFSVPNFIQNSALITKIYIEMKSIFDISYEES